MTEPFDERDEAWLAERARRLWEKHFADVPVGYPILTGFGARAQYRFGSITARNGKALIRVNRLFAHPDVPTFVVDATLAHELAHYVHGFGSGLPRLHTHAHRGGVVEKELERRGLGELDTQADQWRKAHWSAFYAAHCDDLTTRRRLRTETVAQSWDALLEYPGSRTEAELRDRLRQLLPRFGLAPEAAPPFAVAWLHATRRQIGLSYWFRRERVVRLHGLLADRRVPDTVVDFELAYWLARSLVGERWEAVREALRTAGLEAVTTAALNWRRGAWTTFRRRHHPLRQ